jgi:murein DD-endopeptidase MepM/ murein hydrolase activator NlpD
MVNAIVREDARAIDAYTADRDRTEALQAQLLVEQRRLQTLRVETEERRRQLAGQALAKRTALHAVVRERTTAERAIRDLEEDSRRLEALLRSLQAGVTAGGHRALAGFVLPLRGAITSRFGFRRHPIFRLRQFHQGLDIAAPRGTPVAAASGGRVLFAGWYGGYGKLVVLDHGQGLSSLYGHLSVILVRPGQIVTRGQVLGRVGSTGYSTGPHLHYEIRQNGRPVNPAPP